MTNYFIKAKPKMKIGVVYIVTGILHLFTLIIEKLLLSLAEEGQVKW